MQRVKLIGPPGTGKTETLKNIVREKLEQGYDINEIVYTTFTNAAANEAAERVCSDLGLYERPDWFRTEHSCCFRLMNLSPDRTMTRRWLRRFAHKYNYHYSWEQNYHEGYELMDAEGRFLSDAMLKTVGDYCEFFYGLSRNLLVSPMTVWNRRMKGQELPKELNERSFLDYCYRRDEFKRENQLHDFPDMISGCIERGLHPGMKILICDEAQDMSPLQWKLINFWAQFTDEFYVAGDYLQSVYGFQGAEPEMLLTLDADEETLKQSYRLTPEVKRFSEQIARMTGLPYPSFNADEREGEVFRKAFTSIDWMALPETFVLCRTRYLLRLVSDHLMSRMIPFISERGEMNPIQRKEGYALRAILKIRNDMLVSDAEIRAIVELTSQPFIERGVKTHIKKLLQGEYSRRQLWHLGFTKEFFDRLKDPDTILVRAADIPSRRYLMQVLDRYGLNYQPHITLTTMHGSKGRERDLVILNPDLTRTTWDTFCREPMGEILLQYVAATRARQKLMVLHPREMVAFPLPKIDARGQ